MYLEDGAKRFADGLDEGGGEGKESMKSGVFGFQQLRDGEAAGGQGGEGLLDVKCPPDLT